MLADEEFIAQFRPHVVSTTLAVLGSPLDAAPPISLMVTYATACSSRRESRCARPPAASSLGSTANRSIPGQAVLLCPRTKDARRIAELVVNQRPRKG
jgi:hypothetical protein